MRKDVAHVYPLGAGRLSSHLLLPHGEMGASFIHDLSGFVDDVISKNHNFLDACGVLLLRGYDECGVTCGDVRAHRLSHFQVLRQFLNLDVKTGGLVLVLD